MKISNDIPVPCGAWQLSFYGPRFVDVQQFFGTKAVVTSGGTPEVVEVESLYSTESSCYSAASAELMKSINEQMGKAADYATRAAATRD